MEIPLHIKKYVNQYKPIEVDELTFHPITMEEYEAFLVAKQGIEFLQQSLPIQFVSLPFLTALYKYDFEKSVAGESPSGIFSKCLLFLALSLQIGQGKEWNERLECFRIVVDRNDTSRLKSIQFFDNESKMQGEITPIQFARYRPILAAQNGIELADDDVNPDLVKADKEIRSINSPKLEFSIDSMVATVAALSGVDDEKVISWPILKFYKRMEAFSRVVDYTVCKIGEFQGCSWEGGNPSPSLWFNRMRDGLGALREMNERGKNETAKAMQDINETK